MAKELDLSGVDDILAEDQKENKEQELDLSGVDDVLAEDKPSMVDSILDKESPLGPSLRDTGNTVQDMMAGFAEGSTLGAADEIAGAGMTGLEKVLSMIPGTGAHKSKQVDDKLKSEGFQVPEESLADTYAGYQKASEAGFDESSKRSPVLNTAANIGGSIASGIVTGNALGIGGAASKGKKILDIAKDSGKMKAGLELLKRGGMNYAKAAPALALESGLNSDENLVGSNANPEAVGEDVLGGLAFGLPAMLGMDAVTEVAAPTAKKAMSSVINKADELVGDTAFMRKAKKAFEYGEQGINPTSEKAINVLEKEQITNTEDLVERMMVADKKLGVDVGTSLENATKAGQIINVEAPVMKAMNALNYSYQNLQDIASVSRGKQIFDRIANKMGDVSPSDAKSLLDDIDSFIGKFQASNNRSTSENTVLEALMATRKGLSDTIKQQVPEYKLAANRFEEFRRLVPETLLAGKRPQDISGVYMGKLRNRDRQLFDKMEQLSTGATAQGSGAKPVRQAMTNFGEGLDEFHMNENMRGDVNPLNHTKMKSDIRNFSDQAQMLQDMQTVKSPVKTLKADGVIGGLLELGHGGTLVAANTAGRVATPVKKAAVNVYKMPAEALNTYATKLQQVPGLAMYGKALQDGLANGDTAKKNAALFSIMQNPEARLIFNSNNDEEN